MPRVFRPRINFYGPFSDFIFKEKFCVSNPVVEFLHKAIGMHLQRNTVFFLDF